MTSIHDKLSRRALLLGGAGGAALAAWPAVSKAAVPRASVDIGFVDIQSGLTLRRMVARPPNPKGVVLFLHGFPETLYAWKDIAWRLSAEHEVHAFDWPGYGLSSRPPVDAFGYAPSDYARVLKAYIETAGIDKSRLVIYATDIGALPALLLALEDPGLARKIIVGDFAPFDRPQYMHENLQGLKSQPSADVVHAAMNRNRDEILENAFRRGLPKDAQFELSREFKDDMARGWRQNGMSSADAFFHYYAHFTRDQHHLERQLATLKTPVDVIWGEKDFYIQKEMGVEFARKLNKGLTVLADLGHYPHLQRPSQTVREVRAAFG